MAQILVMDDMDEMRMLYEDILGAWGHQVIAFDDASPALAGVDFSEIDLVITDLQMPTPGQLAIRTIRAWGHQVPIIVVSGHVVVSEYDELYRLGAQVVMTKPINFKAFRQNVANLLFLKQISCIEEAK